MVEGLSSRGRNRAGSRVTHPPGWALCAVGLGAVVRMLLLLSFEDVMSSRCSHDPPVCIHLRREAEVSHAFRRAEDLEYLSYFVRRLEYFDGFEANYAPGGASWTFRKSHTEYAVLVLEWWRLSSPWRESRRAPHTGNRLTPVNRDLQHRMP